MNTAFDLPTGSLDKSEASFLSNIREHGWFGTHVFGDEEKELGFSYTTGFYHTLGKPELLIFSMKRQIAHDVFWDLFRRYQNGLEIAESVPNEEVFENGPAVIFPISEKFYKEHLGWSLWFYRWNPFPASQIVWSDRENRFPWDQNFSDEFKSLQDDLTENSWIKTLKSGKAELRRS